MKRHFTAGRGVTFWMVVFLLRGSVADAGELRGEIRDAETGAMVAARVYLQASTGAWHFVNSTAADGKAVEYDKTNWINPRSVEKHTSLSAHPFAVELEPGQYTLTVERGKEYFPEVRRLTIGSEPTQVVVELRRWVNMRELGWYSGETHLHRSLDDLSTVILGEDLNVAFPLSYWVTKAFTAPTAGDRNLEGDIPDHLIRVTDEHVIWPRNTEYEIFTVGEQRHTLGALFILNHRSVLSTGVPPWRSVVEQARREGAIFDMDKLDWPFGMTLPHISGATLYELSNNHLWRTEFAFTNWSVECPPWLQPPRGGKSGGEREWLRYTLGMYYTLLDAGLRLVPTAGTANGVHPVPAGFGRVYVHLPEGFTYERWLEGLQAGRSFVTTGPMLSATANGELPGATLRLDADNPSELTVSGKVRSEHPLAFLEIVSNGRVITTLMPKNGRTPEGAHETAFTAKVPCETSGWLCVRCFEDRPDGRVRFAHTAPWWLEIPGRPLLPTHLERDYLVHRVEEEIERSRHIVPAEALAEYEAALTRFRQLSVRDVESESRAAKDEADLQRWLQNMVWYHGYSRDEILSALKIEPSELDKALDQGKIREGKRVPREADAPLTVLPYPGGRHPRLGFHDGARQPQRDTKVSVFTPWDETSYVVVDVPEAVFTNLGLTYLAHTHVPTIWEQQQVTLPPIEWRRDDDGSFHSERTLPNGIGLGATVRPTRDTVRMELRLHNGTLQPLTKMRAQVCVMLHAAAGFEPQSATNKLIRGNAVAAKSADGHRWIITVWEPCQRPWQNPPVPCIHSDPSLPDCAPGETSVARGILGFYEGDDIAGAIERLTQTLTKSP